LVAGQPLYSWLACQNKRIVLRSQEPVEEHGVLIFPPPTSSTSVLTPTIKYSGSLSWLWNQKDTLEFNYPHSCHSNGNI
jgi:hypothetical protein